MHCIQRLSGSKEQRVCNACLLCLFEHGVLRNAILELQHHRATQWKLSVTSGEHFQTTPLRCSVIMAPAQVEGILSVSWFQSRAWMQIDPHSWYSQHTLFGKKSSGTEYVAQASLKASRSKALYYNLYTRQRVADQASRKKQADRTRVDSCSGRRMPGPDKEQQQSTLCFKPKRNKSRNSKS